MHIVFHYNSLSFIILICFLFCLFLQLLYHWAFFSRVAFYKKKNAVKTDNELEPVSVVICARDAYEYLVDILSALLNQDYPDYEIVIVNDCSEDETEEFLKNIERKEPKIKAVQLRQHLNFFNGKKFPLSMGIKSASNDLLVLTDCNCMPNNDQWLRSVVECYKTHTEVVIGYSPYVRRKTLFNKLIRFDALRQGMFYLSAALSKHPYMGIGKNLSYRKELFYRNKGFTSHYTTSVGDDDIFISQVATKKNTEVLIDANNIITTAAPNNFRLWMRQKSSRYSTFSHYKMGTKVSQCVFLWSQFLFYASFIALFCMPPAFSSAWGSVVYYSILLVLFLLRYGTQLFIYHKASLKLGEKGLLSGLFFYDLFFTFMTPLLRLMGRMNIGVE